MERELRIYIAEDDVGVIDTLRDFIEDQGLGEVVGSSEDDGGDALQIAALQPDLILIDFLMRGHRHRCAAARKRENHRGAAPRAVFGSAGSAAGHG